MGRHFKRYGVTLLFLGLFLAASWLSFAAQPKIYTFPAHLYEGAEITLEVKGLQAPRLKWDFGDGTSVVGGRKLTHIYRRTGNFTIKVMDPKSPQILAEEKIRIIREDRIIKLTRTEIIKGTEITIEAQKFVEPFIRWRFGDGTGEKRGGKTIKHTFNRAGNFEIKAVDFDGKDGKTINARIRVIEDRRVVEYPKEILAGENAELSIKNAAGGNFTWEFSSGPPKKGSSLKDIAFRNPGTVTVTIKDLAGLYPPLKVNLKVIADNRKIRIKDLFALPGEEIEIEAKGFRGKKVKWDFGDGTIKEFASKILKHIYKEPGQYSIKAIDYGGKSLKQFTLRVRVGEFSPGFQPQLMEMAFSDGKFYHVTAHNQPPPSYYLKIKARGRGILKGKWILDDGITVGLFQVQVEDNRVALVEQRQLARLPVNQHGIHTFTLEFTNYRPNFKIPVIKYFVAENGYIEIVSPQPGRKLPLQPTVTLEWKLNPWKHFKQLKKWNPGDLYYEIAISETPFQFLDADALQWQKTGPQEKYTLKTTPYKGWVYWQVRQKGPGGQVMTTSDFGSFRMEKE